MQHFMGNWLLPLQIKHAGLHGQPIKHAGLHGQPLCHLKRASSRAPKGFWTPVSFTPILKLLQACLVAVLPLFKAYIPQLNRPSPVKTCLPEAPLLSRKQCTLCSFHNGY
eukprot:1158149-Pelagomonas_calceolata.AAC.4